MIGVSRRSSGSQESTPRLHQTAQAATIGLDKALRENAFFGWDPYDALSSRRVRQYARTPILRRLVIQGVKRSPINLRRVLGVPKQQHTKGLALLTSAYSRLAAADPSGTSAKQAALLADELTRRGVVRGSGIGWGYDFDVQTRWGYYLAGQPNAIVTAFAGHALIDLSQLTGEEAPLELARQALSFALDELLVSEGDEHFFAYYGGSTTPIHNANVLLAALAARCGCEEELSVARGTLEYTLARQRSCGAWPYGEAPGLSWVDGFHTGYVLWGLATWNSNARPVSADALDVGLRFYINRLIDADGAVRATTERRYPVDVHAAATAIWVLSELASISPAAELAASRVLDWTLLHLRRDDGRFAFQKHRMYRNSTPYVRWSDAHMLLALASYASVEARNG
jgi:hypothetical protein